MLRREKAEAVETSGLGPAALADLAVVHAALGDRVYATRLFRMSLERLKQSPEPNPLPEILVRLQMGEIFFADLSDPVVRAEAVQNMSEIENRLYDLRSHPMATHLQSLVGRHEGRLSRRYEAGKRAGEVAAAEAEIRWSSPEATLKQPAVAEGSSLNGDQTVGQGGTGTEGNGSKAGDVRTTFGRTLRATEAET